MRAAVLVALLLVPALAHAQPGVAELPPPHVAPPTASVAPIKSEGTATLLALGGTAGGVAMLVAGAGSNNEGLAWMGILGFTIGPSLGHVYAGEPGHALATSLIRVAGGGAMLLGAVSLLFDDLDCGLGHDNDGCESNDSGSALLWLGAATVVGATVYDIADAHRAARRANERHARSLMVAPTLVSAANGTSAPALAITGRF